MERAFLAKGSVRGLASAGLDLIRTGSSRVFGVALVISSAFLFAVAFVTGFLPFELASLVTFVLGVSLLAVEIEPVIKLSVAAEGMLGYVQTLDGAMKAMNLAGKATYVPDGKGVKMEMAREGTNLKTSLPSIGQGLFSEIEAQLGDMGGQGLEFFTLWLPRVLVDDLGASDEVRISKKAGLLKVSMSRPFVRRLCVDPFVNANVCCTTGCPLASAVAQTLAATTGKEVRFENCSYEPRSQRAETTLSLQKD